MLLIGPPIKGGCVEFIRIAAIPFAVALLSPLIYALIFRLNIRKEGKMSTDDFVVCAALWLCCTFFCFTAILTAITVLLNIFDEDFGMLQNAIMVPFLLFFAFGSFFITREKTIIKGNAVKHIPGVGRKKYYVMDEITAAKEIFSRGVKSLKVFSKDKKMFTLSGFCIGYNLLLLRIKDLGIKVEAVYK